MFILQHSPSLELKIATAMIQRVVCASARDVTDFPVVRLALRVRFEVSSLQFWCRTERRSCAVLSFRRPEGWIEEALRSVHYQLSRTGTNFAACPDLACRGIQRRVCCCLPTGTSLKLTVILSHWLVTWPHNIHKLWLLRVEVIFTISISWDNKPYYFAVNGVYQWNAERVEFSDLVLIFLENGYKATLNQLNYEKFYLWETCYVFNNFVQYYFDVVHGTVWIITASGIKKNISRRQQGSSSLYGTFQPARVKPK